MTNMANVQQSSYYYILMVRCGSELAVIEDLKERGFQASCPTFIYRRKVRHRRSSTPVTVRRPAIDGYVFVEQWSNIRLDHLRSCEGVLKLVTFAGEPALITHDDLRSIIELSIKLEYNEMTAAERRNLMKKQQGFEGLKSGERISLFYGAITLNGVFVGDGIIEVEIMGNISKVRLKDAYVQRKYLPDDLGLTGSLDDKGVIPAAR